MRSRALTLTVLALLCWVLIGCSPASNTLPASAEHPDATRSDAPPLRIGALASWPRFTPTDADYRGIDADLAHAIGEWMDRPAELHAYGNQDALLQALGDRDIDLAVGVAWPTETRLPAGLSGFSYERGELMRVCSRTAAADTTALAVPRELHAFLEQPAHAATPAVLVEHANLQAIELLTQVTQGTTEGCAVAPRRLARLWARYAPQSTRTEALPVGFSRYVVYRHDRPGFGARLAGLFVSPELRERVRRATHDQFGFLDPLPTRHYAVFHRQLERRLPRYEKLFRAAASHYALDWQLLAAVAYQESHWQAQARSHTGVRGLMMLTRRTALEVGVEDRLDPYQSVWGGARYLRELLDDYGTRITGPDRTWLALAAYNMGRDGLARAQATARERGLDPWRWADLAKVMRGAEDRKWREAAIYVERIRDYEDILRFHLAQAA